MIVSLQAAFAISSFHGNLQNLPPHIFTQLEQARIEIKVSRSFGIKKAKEKVMFIGLCGGK